MPVTIKRKDVGTTRRAVEDLVDAMPRWQLAAMRFNEAVARELGVAGSDLQCLYLLENGGPSRPSRLAGRVGLTTGATSRMVDRLLAAGLVTREPDPDDRRRVVVTIRPDASARLRAVYDPLDDDLRALLIRLDERCLERLRGFVGDAARITDDRTADLARARGEGV